MVINNHAYPVLKLLDNNNSGGPALSRNSISEDDMDYVKTLYSAWMLYKSDVRSNVLLLTEPFIKAAHKSIKAFLRFEWCEYAGMLDDANAGILLYPNKQSIMYWEGTDNINVLFLYECKLICHILWYGKQEEISVIYNDVNHPIDYENAMLFLWEMFILPLLFKKYAKVEIESGPRGKTVQSSIFRGKLKNALDFDVKIMDSTWFTEICRNEGFMVRGHFRLQPYKVNGERVERLIYINEFEKHGYHRQAKINK